MRIRYCRLVNTWEKFSCNFDNSCAILKKSSNWWFGSVLCTAKTPLWLQKPLWGLKPVQVVFCGERQRSPRYQKRCLTSRINRNTATRLISIFDSPSVDEPYTVEYCGLAYSYGELSHGRHPQPILITRSEKKILGFSMKKNMKNHEKACDFEKVNVQNSPFKTFQNHKNQETFTKISLFQKPMQMYHYFFSNDPIFVSC